MAAQAMECRTASGQTFEAPAAAATAFTMAVKDCAPAATRAQAAVAAPVAARPAGSQALPPLLRLYETPQAETRIPLKSTADFQIKWRAAPVVPPAHAAARRRVAKGYTRVAYAVPARGYGGALLGVARAYDIDPAFLQALIRVESGANPYARSSKGALGLMQLMPSTARHFGVDPVRLGEPAANMAAGAAYLKSLQRTYGNNLPLVLAAYNAGQGAVARYHGRVPPYRETTGYVANVLGRYRNALYGRALVAGAEGVGVEAP
jgi:soluble lytic murein transglycosylase-like protein